MTREYWNQNLDTDNLSRQGDGAALDLDEAIRFARTPEFEWLRDQAACLDGKTLLDIGGGLGMQMIIWAREGARVIVADMAEARLQAAREIIRQAEVEDRVQLLAAKAEELPLPDAAVDFVFTKSVLIHTDLPRAAREMYRVLKPGGRGLFIEPLNRNPIIGLYRRLFAPKIWRTITRYFDAKAIGELAEPFDDCRVEKFYLLAAGSFFWQYGLKRCAHFEKSIRFWCTVDRGLMRLLPFLRGWCWFASIRLDKK